MPKRYPAEFRRKVLDLVAAGRPVAQVAADVAISEQTIYVWRRQHLIDTGQLPGTTSSENAELAAAALWVGVAEQEDRGKVVVPIVRGAVVAAMAGYGVVHEHDGGLDRRLKGTSWWARARRPDGRDERRIDRAGRRLARVADPLSYLLCGTPRTGSTLLCDLLTSTGVAGRPESYFRQPDEQAWARRLGVPVAGDGSFDYRSFVRAARIAGSTPNGVFAARVMWGTMQRIVDGLDAPPRRRDLDILVDAFGPLRLVHLRRDDVVGQAVSWARAEQTGYWQEGDRSLVPPRFEFDQVADLVRTIREHNGAWSTWFAAQGVEPHPVTYEDVTANPRQAVRAILDHLGIELPANWRPAARQRRQADEVNADWVRRYRAAQQRSAHTTI